MDVHGLVQYNNIVLTNIGIPIINISSLIARFMRPIWGRQDPGGPHVGPMNFAIWVGLISVFIMGTPTYEKMVFIP